MKTNNKFNFRALAIASLIAIGIATTIATGGGGGGANPPPPPPPPPPPSELLAITAANAEEVSSTLIIALGISFDVGDISGGGVTGQMGAAPPRVLQLMRVGDLVMKPSSGNARKLENCLNGGTVDVTADLANPNTLTVGDSIMAVFVNCDDGDGFIIDGAIDLTIAAIQGDILTDVFLLGLDVLLTDVEITEGTETVTADGDISLTIDSLDYPVLAQTMSGTELSLGSAPEVITLFDFDHRLEVDTGAMAEALLITASGQLDSVLLGGMVEYATPVAVQVIDDEDPYIGEILITGSNDSNVRIVINDSSSITLEVDTNGDGVVDEFIDTNFAALNGNTSTVNSSTAPAIAREVVHAVTGFASVTVSAGGQFIGVAPFGQVRLQAVSGDIGPQDIVCVASGTATVSGFIATAGTYSANDQLGATFNACARNELLNGQLDFMVSSYDQMPGELYLVSGSATATSLERTAAGNVYNGSGDFATTYDNNFTSPGFIYVSTTSTSFTVGHGGIDRLLSGATVDTVITLGPPPLTASRFSSGSMAAPGLVGDFAYQSITADVFLLDTDVATGPFSGELLVTADDDSTLRIVALDELNVRLDIDYEGDAIIDTRLQTTWAALQ